MNSWGFWKKCLPEGWQMGRIGVILLALVLSGQASAPAIAQAACGSYAVAVAPQPVGQPLSDNVIRLVDSTGEVGRVTFAQPGTVTPSPKEGVALLGSLDRLYSLLDVATNSVTPIVIPENQRPSLQPSGPRIHNATEADFMLLADVLGATWLVDLRSGQAVDLTTLLPENGFVENAAIAPNGKWLAFYSGDAAYVISLETPGDPVSISSQPLLRFPGFDASGDQLIYATTATDGVEVNAYDLESGASTLLAKTPSANLLDTSVSDTLLLIDKQDLLALRDGAQQPTKIFTWTGAISGLMRDTSGRHLLIGDEQDGSTVWSWVDIAAGQSISLPELTGMTPLTASRRQDAVVFLPTPIMGPGAPGSPYRTLDMNTGQVATPLAQDSSEVWTYQLAGDDAGRYVLINAVSPGQGRLWLIDGEEGTATEIGLSSGNANARVSPDGCQLAVGIYDTIGEGRTSAVTVTSMTDGSEIAHVADSLLLGWAETASNQ